MKKLLVAVIFILIVGTIVFVMFAHHAKTFSNGKKGDITVGDTIVLEDPTIQTAVGSVTFVVEKTSMGTVQLDFGGANASSNTPFFNGTGDYFYFEILTLVGSSSITAVPNVNWFAPWIIPLPAIIATGTYTYNAAVEVNNTTDPSLQFSGSFINQ